MNRSAPTAVTALGMLMLTGCLSQNSPVTPRYFEPRMAWESSANPQAKETGEKTFLRLEHLTGAPHLREPMVWRVDAMELAFDEHNLWTADPPQLLTQVLTEALFVHGGFRQSPRSTAPSLTVHLEVFEGDLVAGPRAHIALWANLWIDGSSAFRRFEVLEPASAPGPSSLTEAMARALQQVGRDIAGWCREQS